MSLLQQLHDFFKNDAVVAPIEILWANNVDHAVERRVVDHQAGENRLLAQYA